MNFTEAISTFPLILTEAAISEQLRRNPDIALHPTLFNAPLIYDDVYREHLVGIYSSFRDVALKAKIPLLLCAPTWRLDKKRITSAHDFPNLNDDAVQFMRSLQKKWQFESSPLYIGTLLGPQNDCYQPELAPTKEQAAQFHQWQIEKLCLAGTPLFIAQTMPSVDEALGMANVLAESNIPYIISFVISKDCNVLDGTPLAEAMKKLDDAVSTPPLGYMVNCVYPTFLQADKQQSWFFDRLIGIQANSSSKDLNELEGSEQLLQDPLSDWTKKMQQLNREFGVKILGGCCGTDHSYLRSLVA